jgi:aquaporin Z
MPRYLTEDIGTFFLVLTVCLAAGAGAVLAALAIGSALMVMVYMGGHISGAHYNPAVTLAVYLRGKLKTADLVPYWLAQMVGAILAALIAWSLRGETFVAAPPMNMNLGTALLIEVLFTFALALVVLNVATAKATEGNSYFGLAIGFTVTAGAVAGGPISGGAYNPAVGLGPALVHAIYHGGAGVAHVWIYLVGPLIGAALAAGVFKLQHAHTEFAGPPVPAPIERNIKAGAPAGPTSRP